jgi:thiamine pyrophosphokinase
MRKINYSFKYTFQFVLLVASFFSFNINSFGQVTVTPATTVSNLCVGGGFQSLTDIVITEGVTTDFGDGANQTYVISTPVNFRFNLGATVTFTHTSGGGVVSNIQPAVITNTTITFEYDMASTSTGPVDVFNLSGIEVRAVTAPSSGNILRSGGTATQTGNSVGDAQNHGSSVSGNAPSVAVEPVASTICETPGNTSFSVTASGTNPAYQWQESTNGGSSYSNLANGGIYSNVTTATLTLTAATLSESGYLYRAVVSGTCAPPATSNGALLTVEEEANVTVNPLDVTACESTTVSFSVTASGAGLTYQWRENGGNLVDGGIYSGTSTTTLTLTGISSGLNSNTYDVVVTNTAVVCAANATSATATLTVDETPEITVQPAASTICENPGNTTFSVTAGVTTAPTYQWQESTNGGSSYSNLANGGIYSNVTTATLTLTAATLSESGYLYRAVVSGTCAPPATSNGALLTVEEEANVTVNPLDVTACESTTVSFSVTASGAGLTYQWRENGGNLADGGIYSGTSTTTLTLTGISSGLNGNTYDVVVTNTAVVCAANATSATATLTVDETPEITVQPAASTICENPGNTTFSVTAGVTTAPTYQWQESTNGGSSYSNLANGGIYSNVTTATLTLTAASLAENGYLYRAVVSGTCAPPATSNGALLTVEEEANVSIDPLDVTACESTTVTFSVTASGAGLTYQWRENGGNLADAGIYSGTATATLTLTGISSGLDANTYDVVVTNTAVVCAANATSATATLTVDETPEITVQPAASTICENPGNTSFSVTAGVTTAPTYQWQESTNGGSSYSNLANGGIYSNVTTATLTLTAATLSESGYLYRAVVSGTCAPPATSNGALLTVEEEANVTVNPLDVTACESTTVSFSVTASGAGLTYQWRENGGNLANGGIYSNVTTATLTLTGITSGLSGNTYDVVVTNTAVVCAANATSATATLTVDETPEITVQPVVSVICENPGNTTFTVTAGVTTAPTYQWQESTNGGSSYSNLANGGIYSNVTTATLTLTAATLGENGNRYRVIVSGTCSPSVTSDAGILTVEEEANVSIDPSNVTACEGTTVSFSVTASGAGLTYQWRENGGNLADAGIYSGTATATLTLTGISSGLDANTYDVVVTNTAVVCAASATSAAATLTVDETPEITVQPVASVICENPGNTTFTVTAGVTTAPTYQWQESTNGGSSYSNLANGGIYSNVTTATLTLTAATLGENGNRYRVIVSGTCSPSVTSDAGILTVEEEANVSIDPSNVTACESTTVSFSVTASGAGLTYQWRENGGNLANGGIYSNVTTATLTLTGITSGLSGNTYDVVVTNTAVVCAANATSATATLTVDETPEITVQPAASTICENPGNTTFTVTAGVTTAPTYQWQESTNGGSSYSNLANGGIYSNVTTATLTLTAATLGENGNRYRVIVSGTCSPSVTSDAGILTVEEEANVSIDPLDVTACESTTVTFSVTASGAGLTYQWRENGGNLANGGIYSNVTTATLTLTGITSGLSGNTYDVVVTNTAVVCAANATSATATLTVDETPEITVQPAASTICENPGNTSFSVTAGVTTAPTYQWQESTNGGSSYSNLANGGIYSNVTTATLTLTAATLSESGYLYRAIVSGTCAPPATSNGALLTVEEEANVTVNPLDVTACESTTVSFSVTASGAGLTYQWRENGGNLADGGIYSGTSTTTLTLTGISSGLNGNTYDVVVTNTAVVCAASATSAAATLTVDETPEITVQPVASVICENPGNTTFTVTAGVTTAPTYQWQESTNGGSSYSNLANGGIYSNVTTATLTLTAATLGENGNRYRVIVSGTCSPSVTSDAGILTVEEEANVTVNPLDVTACESTTVSFSVTASGAGLTYQWRENGGNLADAGIYSGTATATLTLTGISSGLDANTYDVVVTNTAVVCAASATSAAATLTVDETPEITVQPVASVICENPGNTTFTVTAGVTTAPTYQWQESTNGGSSYSNLANGGIYSNVTTATLTLTAATLGENGNRYRVIVSGTCSPSVTSDAGILTVEEEANVSIDPSNVTACESTTVSFSVTASGAGLTYQWRENGGNLANGGIYSNVTTATLTLTGITSGLSGNTYDVVVTNTAVVCAANATSATATLTVDETPEITVQPAASTICENPGNTTFTVTAGVTTAPTYQWQESTNGGSSYSNLANGGIYSNVTTATLTLTAATLSESGYLYRAIVSGTCAPPATSNGALLTVEEEANVTVNPLDVTACESTTVSFSVTASGAGLTYQWRENGGNLADGGIYSGTSTTTLTLTGISSGLNGNTYDVVVTNTAVVCAASATSAAATLTVDETPEITVQPVASVICENPGNTTFTVTAGVTTAPTYQWQESTNGGSSYSNLANGGIYSNVTTATLTLTAATLGRRVATAIPRNSEQARAPHPCHVHRSAS